jgi:transcriptional regulator with XRE-family HTH domain
MRELAERLTDEFVDKNYAHAYMQEHGNMAIAAQIKAIREQRNLTQGQLAELSGMKQERISALENVDYDAWTVKTLRKLAFAFDTHLNVSFVPFSKGILDLVNLSRKSLAVVPREEDLTLFKERTMIHSGGKWKSLDGDHLATVTKLQRPSTGPVEPGSSWQILGVVNG